MAIVSGVGKFFGDVKKGWENLTYVSPEEQERRKAERERKAALWREEQERQAEYRRIAQEKYEAKKRAAETFARNKRIMMNALTAEGFTDEEAIELAKGMDIFMEEEE